LFLSLAQPREALKVADDETKPQDNPWYRLATFHGERSDPDDIHDEIAGKNRVTWNRWMVSRLTDDLKTELLEAGRCSAEELTPFLGDELRSIEAKIGSSISANQIDFSDTDFESADFGGFVLELSGFLCARR
jgi:hypothetical protein